MKRTGSAIWSGEIKSGGGTVSTESGVLASVPYSFARRFGEKTGTNPDELIGAAHAGCYSMALSGVLGSMGMTANEISTSAVVSIDPAGDGFEITSIHLTVRADIPGADAAKFLEAATAAKEGCPVSKALASVEITLDAALA